jgi:hypothetical protein
MPDRQLDCDAGAHAVAVDVGVLDLQASQQPGPVIRHLLVAQGALDVGRASVRLLFDRYHRRVSANAGRTSSKLVSIVDIAPWSKTSGLPAPWTSW